MAEDFYDSEELLTEIEKDNGNLLRIKKVVFKDENMIDIREYYYNDLKKDYFPTKKGILLQSHELENIDWIAEEISDWLSK